MKKILENSAISTLGFLFVMAFSPLANAAENPFGMSNISTNTQVASNHDEGKCGEGKCAGSSKKSMDRKGKCGNSKKKAMDGEGKCGGSMKKSMDGEDKCGGSMKKSMDGEGKCGDSMKKSMGSGGKCGNM